MMTGTADLARNRRHRLNPSSSCNMTSRITRSISCWSRAANIAAPSWATETVCACLRKKFVNRDSMSSSSSTSSKWDIAAISLRTAPGNCRLMSSSRRFVSLQTHCSGWWIPPTIGARLAGPEPLRRVLRAPHAAVAVIAFVPTRQQCAGGRKFRRQAGRNPPVPSPSPLRRRNERALFIQSPQRQPLVYRERLNRGPGFNRLRLHTASRLSGASTRLQASACQGPERSLPIYKSNQRLAKLHRPNRRPGDYLYGRRLAVRVRAGRRAPRNCRLHVPAIHRGAWQETANHRLGGTSHSSTSPDPDRS